MQTHITSPHTRTIPDWVLRHDESLSRFPAITRVSKDLITVLMKKLKSPYIEANSSVDLLHDEWHATEIMACARSMNIRVSNAVARYAAIRTVLESFRSSTLRDPWNDCYRWRLLLRAALLLDMPLHPDNRLYISWIEAARRALLTDKAASAHAVSFDPMPYDCFGDQDKNRGQDTYRSAHLTTHRNVTPANQDIARRNDNNTGPKCTSEVESMAS